MYKYLILLSLLSSINGYSQQFWHKCGFDHALQQQNELDVNYYSRINSILEEAIRNGTHNAHNRTVFTIPVAVHVVWKNQVDKLDECTIHEQIEVLNEDFRRNNADTALMRSIFDSIVADTEIEFRLDSIIWTQSNVDFHTLGPFGGLLPDPTSLDSVKGVSPPLNPDNYLNIWMVYLGSNGLLGYAYPPDSLPNWPAGTSAPSKNKEGVVLHNEIIGRNNTVSFGGSFGTPVTTINTKGRTAVHEVGHYLGLRHIWGDGTTGGLFPQPSCSVDDGVNDTPNCLDRSNFDCDTSKNSCDVSLPGDLPDMVENYMDYSNEACMNSFTIGQKNLMRGVLLGPRAGLLTTTSKNRPANDAIFNAIEALANNDNSCTLNYPTTTNNASISVPEAGCFSATPHDIWFKFNANSSSISMELLNLNSNAGTLAWELMEGSCDSLVNVQCDSSNAVTFSGLNLGNVYYLRFYDTNNAFTHNFDLCLKNASPLSQDNISQLIQEKINVYPNPSFGQLTIKLDFEFRYSGSISIYNSLGQKISADMLIDEQDTLLNLTIPEHIHGLIYLETVINNIRAIKKIAVIR